MNDTATTVTPPCPQSRSNPTMKFSARNFAAVDAEVMPEDREGDQERQEVDAERLVRVQRGAGRLRVLRDEPR